MSLAHVIQGKLLRLATGVRFQCNICGSRNVRRAREFTREEATCDRCGSTVRMRAVVHHVSTALFGRSYPLTEFPHRPDLRGIGLSDWTVYAKGLAKRLNYTNTFYHAQPHLDITDIPDELAGTCDFVISTDVFEHVVPPVNLAFSGAHRLLKPGGTLVLTVPFMIEEEATREHFPDLFDFQIVEEKERRTLVNRRRDGATEVFDKLVFHGGPGSTLEMRLFARADLSRQLDAVGFSQVRFDDEPHLPFGILWPHPWSVPIVARKAA